MIHADLVCRERKGVHGRPVPEKEDPTDFGLLFVLDLKLLGVSFSKRTRGLVDLTRLGNAIVAGILTFIGGFVVMYWAYRYRYDMWARWNYILAAAFDAGFNFNMLLIFLCFGAGKVISMPNWWGKGKRKEEE